MRCVAAGLFVPTYALWEHGDRLPSFRHLATLTERALQLGVDVVATLPLYAAYLADPFDPSPYSPVSRLHWNEVFLDDATFLDGGWSADERPDAELLDWRHLAQRRRHQLLDAARDLDAATTAALDGFVAGRPDVGDYARFQAEVHGRDDAGVPDGLVRRSHALAQYLGHQQLGAIEGPERAVLALDLPIGSHPLGYETWAHGDLFAPGMAVGAPPDEFFAAGQNWGFPPQLPEHGRRSGHDLWQRLVTRAGEYASMLRIDHVMGVHRLWWIPDGAGAADGVYVRYPREELLAVIAAVAHTAGTTIVGENLGTVSDEVREALARWDVVGLFEEQFQLHRHADRFGQPLDRVPARAVAGIRTHDMPAFASAYADVDAGTAGAYRTALAADIGRPVDDEVGVVLDGALERLARSDAYVVMSDLDDLAGETEPHNVPGKVLATTWRRRLRAPTSEVLDDADVHRRLDVLTHRRSRSS